MLILPIYSTFRFSFPRPQERRELGFLYITLSDSLRFFPPSQGHFPLSGAFRWSGVGGKLMAAVWSFLTYLCLQWDGCMLALFSHISRNQLDVAFPPCRERLQHQRVGPWQEAMVKNSSLSSTTKKPTSWKHTLKIFSVLLLANCKHFKITHDHFSCRHKSYTEWKFIFTYHYSVQIIQHTSAKPFIIFV